MTDFQILRRIEKIERLFQGAKELAVSFGAKQESFAEPEAKLKEVKDDLLKRVSGGIVTNSAQNSQVDGGEYIVRNRG